MHNYLKINLIKKLNLNKIKNKFTNINNFIIWIEITKKVYKSLFSNIEQI